MDDGPAGRRDRRRSASRSPSDLPDFIARQVRADPDTGCWVWTGSLVNGGYGQVWVPRSAPLWTALADTPPGPRRVHRLAWLLLVGPLATGDVLRHRCERRSCCNPDHLERRPAPGPTAPGSP